MKKNLLHMLIAILLLIALIVLTHQAVFLPWWSFLVPLLLAGMWSIRIKWTFPVFMTGFISGFLTWAVGNLFYDQMGHGLVLSRVALMFAAPKIIVILLAGVIGGLLAGLALHTGRALVSPKKEVTMNTGHKL
ncbi:hypothetical protein [Chitinophaga sp. Cy-1792]|uniref:hypothetical protein n=1 Tax=Chitinophaga sp. Cy-1792 TaxID=2608339 RepID=UPI00141E096B|nr:hypothetical protein [Chitinophaga sp. Cy-1792]NIG56798.1 hypothetical protein [Chitinophaga sp. Cy-1792]